MIALRLPLMLLVGLGWTSVLSSALAPRLTSSSRQGCSDSGKHGTLLFGGTDDLSTTRRDFYKQVMGGVSLAFLCTNPLPALAKKTQEDRDKENIVAGYKRLDYLLKNWEQETTACIKGKTFDRGCERTPETVMEYMGYKSMDDPLFRADKTLLRLRDLVPAGQDPEYGEAFDKWVEQADEANGMAYVSSWGEANPGGGKDRVALFLERSKNNVQRAHDSLETVIHILNLDT